MTSATNPPLILSLDPALGARVVGPGMLEWKPPATVPGWEFLRDQPDLYEDEQ